MKFVKIVLVFFMVFSTLSVNFAQVPDTVVVSPTEADGTNADAIRTAMEDPANIGKVFKLQRGGVYFITGDPFTAVDSVSVTIIGEKYPADQPPASIQRGAAEKGSINWSPTFTIYADYVKVENVAFNGYSPEGYGILGNINLAKNGVKAEFNNCLFQGANWGTIWTDGSVDTLILKNCIILNQTQRGHQGHIVNSWGGNPVNAYFTNNTIVCQEGIADPKKHENFVFDHNTIVLEYRETFFNAQQKVQKITNNILYDVAARGYMGFRGTLGVDTIYAGDHIDWQTSLGNSDSLRGIMNVQTFPDSILPDVDRVISFEKNMIFNSSALVDMQNTVGLTPEPLINDRTDSVFNANAGMVISGNIEDINPDFVLVGIGSSVYDSLTVYTKGRRNIDGGNKDTHYHWNYNEAEGGNYTQVLAWPIPMDLKPQAGEAGWGSGTKNYPLGDLNWWGADVVKDWENGVIVGVSKEETNLPYAYVLSQNYPNPFNPSTKIVYQIPEIGNVKLEIYDITGQKVKTLVDESHHSVGISEVNWNGTNDYGVNVGSGVYFYRISAGNNFVQSKKMLFLK